MSTFASANSIAKASIGEIIDNALARQRLPAFVRSQTRELFDYCKDKPHIRSELQTIIKLSAHDASVVYRGLIIQLNGIFESFIKSLVSAQIHNISTKAECFDDLEEGVKTSYIFYIGNVFSKVHDGAINGVNYDFDTLKREVGSCFSNVSPFSMSGEVFTLLMGNCTPKRLEKIFSQVGLPEPFSDVFGKHKAVQQWCSEGKARRVATMARDELEKQISLRNELVHGLGTKNVVLEDVQNSARFFLAIIDAYTDLAEENK